ncbi:MAG: VOC family protein [Calditrichaeota bacterium]|nr:MAG: VOC family protein [Calditrichota bacterium]
MGQITQHPEGTFCWYELLAEDLSLARAFYTQLFGWSTQDNPIGEGLVYVMLQKDGQDVGAMYQISDSQKKSGLRPGWLSYIAVDNVDATAEQARSLGAQVVYEPLDVFTAGRMSLLTDPAGAFFALWQAREHPGAGVVREPGTFCWNELITTDADAAEAFYTRLFGWTTEVGDFDGFKYTSFLREGSPVGGMMPMIKEWGDTPSHWLIYFAVDDCDAVAEKASSLGASLQVPPMDVPEVGRFSLIRDPQGGTFAIIRLLQET